MDQHAVLEQVLGWARGEPNIRVMVLTGSLARGTKTDDLSDLDVELYVRDPSLLLERNGWYRQFGEVLVVEELENPGWHPTRLVYYADGKIDFMVAPALVLRDGLTYDHPFRVLLDKDNAAAALRMTASPGKSRPTGSEFTRCVHWFYAAAIMWAKCLARADLWAAKARDWDSKVEMLTMIEWDHRARYGWNYDTSFGGTHLHDWMDAEIIAAVTRCWSGFSLEDQAAGLRASVELFDLLSTRTAVALGLDPFDGTAVHRRVDDLFGKG